MKKILMMVCAAAALTGCGSTGGRSASTEQPPTPVADTATVAQSDTAARHTRLAGGYSEQREPTAEELALFKKVTAELDGVGYTPRSVATQVVAGRNYRFICTATTITREPQTYTAAVVIYQPLPGQGEAKITSIEKL